MKTRVITISAVSASLIAIVLTLGAFIQFVDVLSVIFASVFVILPLYCNSYKGCFLSYFAGGILAFIIGAVFNVFSFVFPAYFLYFGLFPIVRNIFKDKNVKKWIILLVGIIWSVAAFYGIYFYMIYVAGEVLSGVPEWLKDYLIYLVGVLGVVFYFLFSRFVIITRTLADKYLNKKIKK